MGAGTVTLDEEQAIELIAYMLSSAQGLLREPDKYAVLRMASAADRMAAMWAPRADGALGEFLADLAQRMPVAAASTQGDDISDFSNYLAEKLTELANIVKDRELPEITGGT